MINFFIGKTVKNPNVDGEYSEQNANQGHCCKLVDKFDAKKDNGTHTYKTKEANHRVLTRNFQSQKASSIEKIQLR